MTALLHRVAAGSAIAVAATAAVAFGTGTAAADVPFAEGGCTAYNAVGLGALSMCSQPTWHRAHAVCYNSGRWPRSYDWAHLGNYDSWGAPAFGNAVSWAPCTFPDAVVMVEVVPG